MEIIAAIIAFILMTVMGTIVASFASHLFGLHQFGNISIADITVGLLLGLYSAYSSYKAEVKRKQKKQQEKKQDSCSRGPIRRLGEWIFDGRSPWK